MPKFKPQTYYWILFITSYILFSKYIFEILSQTSSSPNFCLCFIGFLIFCSWIFFGFFILYTLILIPSLFLHWALFESNSVSPRILYKRFKNYAPFLKVLWSDKL